MDETPIGIVAPPPQQPSQSAPGSARGSPTSLTAPSAAAEASAATAAPGTARPPPPAAPALEYPPVAEMADVMDEYQALTERLSQHWSRLTEVLRADPESGSEEETRDRQALFNQVTQVMHLMSHSQHALSDLMLNFDRPRPRVLRASPFIFPLPVQTTITATGPPVRFATAAAAASPSASPAASRRQVSGATSSSAASDSTAAPATMTASASATPPATSESAAPQHGGSQQLHQHLQQHMQHVQAALGGHVTASAAATNAATRQQAPHAQNVRVAQVPVGPQGVGPIVVGIPIDVTATQSGVGANVNGRPAQQNFLESILRPALNGIAEGGSGSMSFEITTSSQGSASTLAPGENSSSPTVQDTTARQSTQTLPTASTRTPRATPHIHYAAAPFPPPPQMPSALNGVAYGSPMGSHFDPFLPCQSHHVTPPRARQQGRRMPPQRPRSASVPPRNNGNNAELGADQGQRPGGGGSGAGSPQLAQRRFVATAPPPPGFIFGPPPHPGMGRGWLVNAAAPHGHLVSMGTPPSRQRHPPPPQPPPEAVLDPSLQGLLNQLRASNSGSQDEANMINMVQGILGQVIGALGGGGPGLGLGGTVADFLNGLPDYQYTEGESTLTDFLMTLARNMTFGDLIPLVLGQGNVQVNQLQQPLNQFVRSNILQTETDDPSDEVRCVSQ